MARVVRCTLLVGLLGAEIAFCILAWQRWGTYALFRIAAALLSVTVFGALLAYVRWHLIAMPTRRHLFAEVQGFAPSSSDTTRPRANRPTRRANRTRRRRSESP